MQFGGLRRCGEQLAIYDDRIGLGTPVPFLAISPWSKRGYVNSQVFDHTLLIRFIEKRFGVRVQYLPVAPGRRR
jgi:phospholipase C